MSRRWWWVLVVLAPLFLFLHTESGSADIKDGAEPSDLEIIRTAFDRMFNYSSVRTVSFRIHRAGGRILHRDFDIVYKRVEGNGHTLVRFTSPEYLRDSAMLIIERPGGRNDTWLYRPSDRRPRRVSTAQRADSFFGSDFTLEDLEHHDWTTFELERLPDAMEQGVLCYVIEATPAGSSQYRKMSAWVGRENFSLLRVDFFQGDGTEPVKQLVIDPKEIDVVDGLVMPKRMWLRQNGRDQSTEVLFDRIETDSEITERVFTLMRLERSGRDLYDLVERLGPGESE